MKINDWLYAARYECHTLKDSDHCDHFTAVCAYVESFPSSSSLPLFISPSLPVCLAELYNCFFLVSILAVLNYVRIQTGCRFTVGLSEVDLICDIHQKYQTKNPVWQPFLPFHTACLFNVLGNGDRFAFEAFCPPCKMKGLIPVQAQHVWTRAADRSANWLWFCLWTS